MNQMQYRNPLKGPQKPRSWF